MAINLSKTEFAPPFSRQAATLAKRGGEKLPTAWARRHENLENVSRLTDLNQVAHRRKSHLV